jgi:heme o synthase
MRIPYRPYHELCRLSVALLATFSATVGYLLSAPLIDVSIIPVMLGVLLLCCGALSLNQYQERGLDVLMERTRMRPIPSGRIAPANALAFSLVLFLLGFSLLLPTTRGEGVAGLGACALFWYNGVYTPLKRKSAFAAVPGALIGAVPPAMGWLAGGGALQDPKLLALCFFFFLWQVPHSWLFLTAYEGDYKRAGIPTVTGTFPAVQLRRIIVTWIVATTVSCLFLSTRGLVQHFSMNCALLVFSLWFAVQAMAPLFRSGTLYPSLSVFRRANYYLLTVLLLLSADKIAPVPF